MPYNPNVENATYLAETVMQPLVGGEIIGLMLDGENGFAGFKVRQTDGVVVRCWLSMDPEGNGCGWLAVEPDAG